MNDNLYVQVVAIVAGADVFSAKDDEPVMSFQRLGVRAMTISQTAEYALRAVVWLAGHAEAAMGTPEIARSTRVPPGYLAKVLQLLRFLVYPPNF